MATDAPSVPVRAQLDRHLPKRQQRNAAGSEFTAEGHVGLKVAQRNAHVVTDAPSVPVRAQLDRRLPKRQQRNAAGSKLISAGLPET